MFLLTLSHSIMESQKAVLHEPAIFTRALLGFPCSCQGGNITIKSWIPQPPPLEIIPKALPELGWLRAIEGVVQGERLLELRNPYTKVRDMAHDLIAMDAS